MHQENIAKQNAAAVERFDKSKHVGTRYDPVLGRRVPVADESELPTPKLPADLIMEL